MGCGSCTTKAKRATVVKVTSKEEKKAVKKKKVKPAVKYMHVKSSGTNKKRAFNTLQAREQKRIRRKEKQI